MTQSIRTTFTCFASWLLMLLLLQHPIAAVHGDATEVPDGIPFRTLYDATRADHDRMGVEYNAAVLQKTKDNLLAMLHSQGDQYLGAYVTLMEHNVQTASRALRAGEDDETVVMSLFHDVFETLAVKNHGELMAAMLAPWISPRNQWLLAHHEIFQGFYYFRHFDGLDPNQRDMFLDHPYYNWTATWCERYDQASFDPDYESLPLEAFDGAIDRVLARPQYWWNPQHPKAGAIAGDSARDSRVVNEEACAASNSSGASASGVPFVENCENTWTCLGPAPLESLA